jgi:hypothetical protein
MSRYDKNLIEEEAIKSIRNGRITEPIGQFTLDRAEEISAGIFKPTSEEFHNALVDYAVLKVCEEFLDKYVEGRSAANLIISMVHSGMIDRIRAARWKDVYGELNKSHVQVVDIEGRRKSELMQTSKDDTISRVLSGDNVNDLL